jgi:hypothetical protein
MCGILETGGEMQAVRRMTNSEKLMIAMESYKMEDAGRKDEALAYRMDKIPLEPWLAKIIKEKAGLDCLLGGGWNLTEVEAEFGRNWLNR